MIAPMLFPQTENLTGRCFVSLNLQGLLEVKVLHGLYRKSDDTPPLMLIPSAISQLVLGRHSMGGSFSRGR